MSSFHPLPFITWLRSIPPPLLSTPEVQSRLHQLPSNIGKFQGNELAGVAFYLGKLGYWEKEVWDYIDMKVARSGAVEEMSVKAVERLMEVYVERDMEELVRAEALERMENAVLGVVKRDLQTGQSLMSVRECSGFMWSFVLSRRGSAALYSSMECLYMRQLRFQPHQLPDFSKIAFSYVYSGYETPRLMTHIHSHSQLLPPVSPWTSLLQWSLFKSKSRVIVYIS